MIADGITISTTAITALLGGGGLTAWIMNGRIKRKCDNCDEHQKLVVVVANTREDLAAMRADIKNLCRSMDEIREDVRALRR